MDNDGAHKFAFGVPEVFADLLRLVFPEWADALDFDNAEEVSAAYVQRFGGGFRQRFGDMLWRVPFKEGRLKDGSRPYILAPVEFQSTVDRTMAQRMRDYVEMLRERLAKAGVAEREGGLPWVLPIVVYSGAERWTASGGMDDLAPLPSSAARLALAPYQQRAYLSWSLEGLLARGGGSLAGLPARNRAAATLRLQVAGTPVGCWRSCARSGRGSRGPARRPRGKRCTRGRRRCWRRGRATARCRRSMSWSGSRETMR